MKAFTIFEPGISSIVDLPMPAPTSGQVLVRSRYVGLCGTDVELLQGRVHENMRRYPCIPGHEWSGVIEQIGDEVTDLNPGDPVVVEGVQYCGRCRFCRGGLTNLCMHKQELGFTLPGGLSQYVCVDARTVHRLPRELPLTHAALIEPTAVVTRGILRARPHPGSTVAVIGPGTIGLLAVSLVRMFSPSRLFLLGITEQSLALGAKVGATDVIRIDDLNAEQRMLEATHGLGVDLAIECAGHTRAVETAYRVVRPGGKVVLLGAAGNSARIEMLSDLFHAKDLEIHGILSYTQFTWQDAVHLMAQGHIPASDIIQNQCAFTEVEEALMGLSRGYSIGKTLVTMPE